MTLFIILLIGFSIISSGVLYLVYAGFLHNVNKSPRALISCALLLVSLICLQLGHIQFLFDGIDPLSSNRYLLSLFLVPPMFYIFGRSILFDETRLHPSLVVHIIPVALPFILRFEIASALLFFIGTAYSFWLTHVIYRSVNKRIRYRFERFFFIVFSLLAIGVLLLGLSLPYINPVWFYTFYAVAISTTMIGIVTVLLIFPELLADIAEAAKASYTQSTLSGINVEEKKQELQKQMTEARVYQQDDLSLAMLAEALQLSSHQLSELINTEFGVNFSKYIRQYRIKEAITLLRSEPKASILSISLQVGFRSQSNFYAAFKEITGKSPSDYRK